MTPPLIGKFADSYPSKAVRALSSAVRALTGRQLAGRNATVFDDDIFIASYPRSGNTWTRFLIGNLIYQDDPVTFRNIESRIPEIYFNPDHVMRRLPRPRILKSHESFQPQYPRVIYIVRDPRDVCVSFYYHHLKWRNIPDNYSMDEFVGRFLQADFDRSFGSWADNVGSWINMREGSPTFLLLRYEDMKQDPIRELQKAAAFLKRNLFPRVDVTPSRLSRAVELSSLDQMRQLEKSQSRDWVLTRKTRQDQPFVRSAVAGSWKSTLSQHSVAAIEEALASWMQRLGYKLSSADSELG